MTRSREGIFSKAIDWAALESGAASPAQRQSDVSERQSKRDQALMRRLAQLRTAMGDDSPPTTAKALAPEAGLDPVPSVPATTTGIIQLIAARNAYWPMLSATALMLAGAAWYLLNQPSAAPSDLTLAAGRATPGTLEAVAPAADKTLVAAVTNPPAPVAELTQPPPPLLAAAATTTPIASSPAIPPPDPEAQLRELVESWRQAWSGRDTKAYLSFYGKAFQPAKGLSLDRWIASRHRNVGGKADIKVEINDLQLTIVDGQQARVTFLQDYSSGRYKETAQPKTLLLVREGDVWRIVKEWQGSEDS